MKPLKTGQLRQALHSEIIHIDKAEPATFGEIALYLFTAGRRGRVYRAKCAPVRRWNAPEHFNCRCARVTVNGEEV